MKILLCHNYYQQPGGEDRVFEGEANLLKENGHEILKYTKHNDAIFGMNPVVVAIKAIWNQEVYKEIKNLVTTFKPDVVHFHNTFPLISPSAYYAAKSGGARVVQTLHNFRMICPSANLFRDGNVCEDCLRKFYPWPGIYHRCYHQNAKETAVIASMLFLHRMIGTYHRMVDRYLALTDFARMKFIEGGFKPEKISAKPNFVSQNQKVTKNKGEYFLFIGRLAYEKGVTTLLAVAKELGDIPVKIAGDGPMMDEVTRYVKEHELSNVDILGYCNQEKLKQIFEKTIALIIPSIWYEPFGLAIIEAFSNQVPVIASAIGGIPEIITDGENGFLFTPGNVFELASIMAQCYQNRDNLSGMNENAFQVFSKKYSSEVVYRQLMKIYEE